MAQENEFKSEVNIVIASRFYNESIARLNQSILKDAGIESFLSNHHTSNLIPFGDGGILLHVKEQDLEESLKIIKKTLIDFQTRPEEDFSNADLADIEYEKNISREERRLSAAKSISTLGWILWISLGVVLSLLISYLINFN